jgi:predicted kinase
MSQHIKVLRGVQGSGKSTEALKWVRQDPLNRARVNRDDIRLTNFGSYDIPQELEYAVTKIEHQLIRTLLKAKKSVVIDNVNLRAKYVKEYLLIADEFNVPVLYQDFPVELEVALARNAARERKVPEDVIVKTHKRYIQSGKFPEFPQLSYDMSGLYVPDETLPKAILLDVDGTAMKIGKHRGPYDFDKVIDDEPNFPVITTVQSLVAHEGYKVIVMSGRDEVCKQDTLFSLEVAGVPVDEIYMRPQGDRRPDTIIKRELFDANVRNRFNVLFALDDRDVVVDMYRKDLGLTVFQVDYGNF